MVAGRLHYRSYSDYGGFCLRDYFSGPVNLIYGRLLGQWNLDAFALFHANGADTSFGYCPRDEQANKGAFDHYRQDGKNTLTGRSTGHLSVHWRCG